MWGPQLKIRRSSTTRENKAPSLDHKSFQIYAYNSYKPWTKTVVRRVDTAPYGLEIPTWGSWSQSHPGRIRCRSRIINPSINLQLQETGDENGGPPGQYRPVPCGNSNLRVVNSAPPRDNKVPSPDHKSFRISTTPTNRGRKRRSLCSTPPRTVCKPQPGVRRDSPTGGGEGVIPNPLILTYIYNSNKPGTKAAVPRVDTAPYSV